jgi:ribosome maturation factor RimP
MAKKNIEETVTELVLPIVLSKSFELVDVEFVKEGTNWYLRIYIDKEGGINIDDCQSVSEDLSQKLDEIDPIKQSYFLEVSSPGLERQLKREKDFEKFKGETVEVKLYQPFEGKKVFEGELIGLVNNVISIKYGTETILNFEKEKVISVRRVIKF